MNGLQLTTIIRRKTRTNSTTYSDADLLVDINIMKDELASRIQQFRQEIWNVPALDNLVANQREYAFPADVLNNIVSLELKFSASGDYVIATPIARRHYKDVIQESKIVDNFDNLDPKYFIRRNAVYVLSGTIIAVTDGFKLVYNSFPVDLANLTGETDLSVDPSNTTHGFPREFHELLARRIGIEYKSNHNQVLNKKELDYDDDLQKALDDFSIVNLNEEITGAVPSGLAGADNGFNY